MSEQNEKLKHLEFLQNVITRMNRNSFQLKGWAITIVSAILALAASTKNYDILYAGLLAPVVFWFLDAYYLHQERKYRALYEDAAELSDTPNPVDRFSMNAGDYEKGVGAYVSVLLSRTIWPIYVATIGIVTVSLLWLSRS